MCNQILALNLQVVSSNVSAINGFHKILKLVGKNWCLTVVYDIEKIDLHNNRKNWAETYLRGYFFTSIERTILTHLFNVYLFVEIYLIYSLSILIGITSTQRVESMHRIIKVGLYSNIKLYKLIQLFKQVIAKQRDKDRDSDHKTIYIYHAIEGVLYSVKSHAVKIYTRNCYNLLCKEMTLESRYAAEGKKQKADHPNMPIFY